MKSEIQNSFVGRINRYIFLFFRFGIFTHLLPYSISTLLCPSIQIKGKPFVFAFLHRLPHTIHTRKYTLACVVRVRVSCLFLFLCKWHFSYFSILRYLFNFPLPFNSSALDVGIAPKANCIRYYSYFIY